MSVGERTEVFSGLCLTRRAKSSVFQISYIFQILVNAAS